MAKLPYSRFPRGVAHSHLIGASDGTRCCAGAPAPRLAPADVEGRPEEVTVMKRDGVFALNDEESGAVDLGTAQTFFNRTVKTPAHR